MENFEQFLTGKLMIACPTAKNDIINRSIIYICSQDENETIGFIINKKQKDFISCETIASADFDITNIAFYKGGNEDCCKVFIIHTNDYTLNNSMQIDKHIGISSSVEIIKDIACRKGPQKSKFVLGYLQWDTQKLINEIKANNWWLLEEDDSILFSDDNENKWEEIMLESLNIDIKRLFTNNGNA